MNKTASLFLILNLFFISSSLSGEENPSVNTPKEVDKDKKEEPTVVKEEKKKKEESSKIDNEEVNNAKNPAEKQVEAPPKIGNFSLPTSQQPAALFGFGGNIIDQGEVQLYFFADAFSGRKRIVTDLIPSILFGITDTWSIYFNFPFTPIMRDGRNISSGLEDYFIQLEYAFYNKSTKTYTDQATVVVNVTVPTGSVKKNPPTGFGGPSLFLGGTYYHTLVDWFVFTAPGAVLTTPENRIKIGDQFLYQFGFGRNICAPKGWIYAWMLEIDGQYTKKNRLGHHYDKNSGGNVIYATPSLWISSKEMLIQFGVSLPVTQHLFGNQRKLDFAFNFNFAWSFY